AARAGAHPRGALGPTRRRSRFRSRGHSKPCPLRLRDPSLPLSPRGPAGAHHAWAARRRGRHHSPSESQEGPSRGLGEPPSAQYRRPSGLHHARGRVRTARRCVESSATSAIGTLSPSSFLVFVGWSTAAMTRLGLPPSPGCPSTSGRRQARTLISRPCSPPTGTKEHPASPTHGR